MPRYFIEVAYKGTNYSGFQIQKNAVTIQSEVQKALRVFFKKDFSITGSSRTDAGVHALQNYFHFDVDEDLDRKKVIKKVKNSLVSPPSGGEDLTAHSAGLEKALYNLNAILPDDIVIKKIFPVTDASHCRFDAISREYKYFIYTKKDPFLKEKAYYYPYNPDISKLNQAAAILLEYNDFTSFSKQNTQVNNFLCTLTKSEWCKEGDMIVYNVIGNRFLRGMVKGLVGTMLKISSGKISLTSFKKIIENKNASKADFTPPSNGLFLASVKYNSIF